MRVFIASKVSCEHQQSLNKRIRDLCRSMGWQTYLPQLELPVSGNAEPEQILRANETAIDVSEVVVVVFDNAGSGCAMELERARLKGKIIVGYRTQTSLSNEYLGKMLEGAWSLIPRSFQAASLRELQDVFTRILSESERRHAGDAVSKRMFHDDSTGRGEEDHAFV